MTDEFAKLITTKLYAHTRVYGDKFNLRYITVIISRGHASDDPWMVTYSIGSYGDIDKTEGADLYACINEYMRRKGWTEANKPMILIEAPKEDDDPDPQPVLDDDVPS